MVSDKREQDIVVQIALHFDRLDVRIPRLKKLVKTICHLFKLSKATISIAIVDDAEIRKVNKRFLKRDCPTDCLSFDLSDDGASAKILEVLVNGEMACRQAELRGHSSEAELALYITHSLLHNLGFDDSTKNQSEKMHETEDKILRQLGYGLVYNKSIRA